MKAFSILSLFAAGRSSREREMAYLNQSVSMTDLERRQRDVARGKFRTF